MSIKKIVHLKDFYWVMESSAQIRQKLFNQYLAHSNLFGAEQLNKILDLLLQIPSTPEGTYKLSLDKHKSIELDLTYEIEELKKDIFFLKFGEEAFLNYLETLHTNFARELSQGKKFLQDMHFNSCITDRDGTTNNYCGRYRSSVQSLYNAIFLTHFAKLKTKNFIFLTSAPLQNPGIINVALDGPFVYAASKGRELININKEHRNFPIEDEKQKQLNKLNDDIAKLLQQKKYEIYSLIGSGYQIKFGQLTIARQDIAKSIPQKESEEFLQLITQLVKKADPGQQFFRIEDTGLDIEIILTIDDQSQGTKDFDKGDGVKYLNQELGLQMEKGPHLICGDTSSDLPMLAAAMNFCPDTRAIFVTQNEQLKQKVMDTCPHSFFVSTPDILVTTLNCQLKG